MGRIKVSKTKTSILFLTTVILSLPFLANLLYMRNNSIKFVAESTVLSLNTDAYFSRIFEKGYHSVHGNDTKLLIQYFPLFSIIHMLGKVFSQSEAYILTLLMLYLTGHLHLIRLLSHHGPNDGYTTSLVASTSLLFFSSLSIFNYLKSNIIFSLPYLILPPILLYSSRFIRVGRVVDLFLTIVCCYILFSSNITHQIIVVVIVNLYIIYQYIQNKTRVVLNFRRLVCLNTLFALMVSYTSYNVLWSIEQYGPISVTTSIIKEDFYGQSANVLKVLLQQTDWGLFSGWNNEPYYLFSGYYRDSSVRMLGLLLYILYLVLLTRKNNGDNKKTIILSSCIVIIIFIMTGSGSSLYRFLYENVLPFHVFRNITKLSPALLLAVLLVISYTGYQSKRHTWILPVLWICLIYNLPYWSYWKYFFESRSIGEIPHEYVAAGDYINDNIQEKGAVLALPAVYTTESYIWSGSKKDVQGDLFDLYQNGVVIRLSEKFLGSTSMQKAVNKVFKSCDSSPRKQCIIYTELEKILTTKGISYILVTKDMVFEYDNINEIENWLERIQARKIHTWNSVDLYQINL